MTLKNKFYQHIQKNHFFSNGTRLLLAVSGGVDSMVLLTLMNEVKAQFHLELGVVHINHQLREVSLAEAQLVATFCATLDVPFYESVWLEGKTITHNIEAQARDFRYQTFVSVAKEYDYEYIVTAHHGDDQVETMMMKLLNGSLLRNLAGILPVRLYQDCKIVRPLLPFSKEELYDYAEKYQVPYMEDKSNIATFYFRNRLRHQLIPKMRKESPKLSQHFQNLSKQIAYTNNVIDELVREDAQKITISEEESVLSFDLLLWRQLSEARQYFLLVFYLQKTLVASKVEVNEEKVQEILQVLLNEGAPNQELFLGQHWQLVKSYETVWIRKSTLESQWVERQEPNSSVFFLGPNEKVHVTEEESFAVMEAEGVSQDAFFLDLPTAVAWPLRIRHFTEGDKLLLKDGKHQKVSRLFINQKIPLALRRKTWLVEDGEGQLLWAVPLKKSYLSIIEETDKIHYRLIYSRNVE